MFETWGRVVYRRRRLILWLALLGVVFAAVWGTGVFSRLQTSGGFTAPNSQSVQSSNLAADAFGRDAGDVVVLYRSPAASVHSPAFPAAVTRSLAAVPHRKVVQYQTYWSARSPPFVGASGHETYAVLELAGDTDAAKIKSFDAIKGGLAAPGLSTRVGGQIPSEQTINKQVTSDIGRAETLSMPVLLILLAVIFGSLAAASLPLAIGVIAILGSFTALRLLTLATPVSIYSINITTILGLGLAIDYGLFMVGRFREELHRQDSVEAALARTVATAGRTVAVSGLTVAVALASLMLFPEVFLRSMGYGGVATVLVDMLAALTVLPALLAVLGPKVNALRIRRSVQRAPAAEASGGWYRLARSVMRRPVIYLAVIVIFLLTLGAPFLKVAWGGTDARVLPGASAPRQVTEALNQNFPGNATSPIESLLTFTGPVAGSPAPGAQLTSYVSSLTRIPGVTGSQVTGVKGGVARIGTRYRAAPLSAAARQIVRQGRAIPSPAGGAARIGGAAP